MEAVTGLTGAAITPGVITATSVGVLASFGALFSFNLPKIVSDLTELSGKIVSGEKLGREWGAKEQVSENPSPKQNESFVAKTKQELNKHLEAEFKKDTDKDNRKSYQQRVRESSEQANELSRN